MNKTTEKTTSLLLEYLNATAKDLTQVPSFIKQEIQSCIDLYNQDISLYNDQDSLFNRYYQSEMAIELKQYLLFLRNSLIEWNKASVKLESKNVSEESFVDFNDKLRHSITRTRTELATIFEEKIKQYRMPGFIDGYRYKSSLENDASAIYSRQFGLIKEQVQTLLSNDKKVKKVNNQFNYINAKLAKYFDSIVGFINKIQDVPSNVIENIESKEQIEEALEESHKIIENTIHELSKDEHTSKNLLEFIQNMEEVPLIVDYDGGQVIERRFKLNSQLEAWLNVEILTLHSQLKNKLFMFVQLAEKKHRNSIAKLHLITKENEEQYLDEIKSLMVEHGEETKKLQDLLKEQIENKKSNIEQTLNINQLYNNGTWLDLGLQNAFSQFKLGTEGVFKYLADKYKEVREKVITFKENNLYDTKVRLNESIVKYVRDRSLTPAELSYTDIFLDNIKVSNYYLVNRKKQLEKIKYAFETWNEGFGISAIITGAPNSGKTTFVQQICNEFWPKTNYHLAPNSQQVVMGRKFNTSCDLGEALIEMSKSTNTDDYICVIIDDLELWRDESISLEENVQSLMHFYSRNKSNIFFVCVLNPQLLRALNIIYDFQEIFTYVIDLSKATEQEYLDSTRIRHESTHKNLINEDGSTISQINLRRKALSIFHENHFNLGASLLEWASSVTTAEGSDVIFSKHESIAPWLLSNKYMYILNYILLHGSISEIEIIKTLTPAEKEETRAFLGKMLMLKLLIRGNDQKIQINPVISNEIYYQFSSIANEEVFNYVIRSNKVDLDLIAIKQQVISLLFRYPFQLLDTKIDITLHKKRISIKLQTGESPSQIMAYLNNHLDQITFEFLHRI